MKSNSPLLFVLLLLMSCQSHTATYAQASATVIQNREPKEQDQIQLTPDIAVPAAEPGYTLILPDKKPKGMVVLFHQGRDTTHAGYEMRLYAEAVQREVAALYVTTGNPFEFLFDKVRYEQLDRYIGEVVRKYEIPEDRLLFAGMSLAGTRALKFGLWCQENKSKYGLHPRAIATCDAPLDFIRFWKEGARAIELQVSPISVNEARWVNRQLEEHLGGTPLEAPEAYRTYSPYVYSPEIDERLKLLDGVAFRAYTEPDVDWWMKNRHKSYYGMNALDAAAIVTDLQILGNEEAELITTSGKGYHPDGQRHPHSWSIVDNGELVEWLLGLE